MVIVQVKEADTNIVGKKLVTIDQAVQRSLGLRHGGYLVIKGHKEAVVQVWPSKRLDDGTKIIRMDSFTRKNAGASIGDKVEIKKIEPNSAKKIVLAPLEVIRFNGTGYTRLLKKQFMGKPFIVGEKILFSIFGNPFILQVQSTMPKGYIKIDDFTQIDILETPTSPTDENLIKVSYDDIGGLGKQINTIKEMIELPMKHPEIFKKLGINPPKGILFYGPPGTGKTMLAKAIASEANANFFIINGPSIMSKYVGGAEERLRQIFKDAEENAPAIIFIDEIDAIAPERGESGGDVEKRVVAQLLSIMDGLEARGEVIVIAATNRPNSIDNALRRPGRFDKELEIGVPDKIGRKEILNIATKYMPLNENVNLDKITDITHGFVGADLSALAKEAGMQAIRRMLPDININSEEIPEDVLENMTIIQDDFINALNEINPSALREVFIEVPNINWEDIGALDNVKNELKKAVEWPLKYEDKFTKLNIEPIKGILLYGPPGTGKTMLAKAIANETEANFISIRGPELFNKWLGESEKAIRKIFYKAKQTAPCIVFFDEIDAIATKRSASEENNTTSRIVNQLLTELDGLTISKGIVFIAATNRLNVLDPALLRPGRIDKIIKVGLPDENARLDILKTIAKKIKIDNETNLKNIAKKTDGYSGADLNAIIKEAGLIAIENHILNPEKEISITQKDIDMALEKLEKNKDINSNDLDEKEEKQNYIR